MQIDQMVSAGSLADLSLPMRVSSSVCSFHAAPRAQTNDGANALTKAVAAGAKDAAAVLLAETQRRAADEARALLEWLQVKGLKSDFEAALPKAAAAAAERIAGYELAKKAEEEARKVEEARAAAAAAAEAAEAAAQAADDGEEADDGGNKEL